MMSEPGMALFMQQQEEDLQEMIAYIESSSITLNVMIPVVVHIVHANHSEGLLDNLDQDRVTNAIANLNADYNGTGIQFCPAKRMQDGTPLVELGIVRANAAAVPGYSSGIGIRSDREREVKELGPQFSNFNYLNIWTVHTIMANNGNGQIRGFAYFTNTSSASTDGVTMMTEFFGIPNNRILTHEVGHYLDLYHTFQGDGDGPYWGW